MYVMLAERDRNGRDYLGHLMSHFICQLSLLFTLLTVSRRYLEEEDIFNFESLSKRNYKQNATKKACSSHHLMPLLREQALLSTLSVEYRI